VGDHFVILRRGTVFGDYKKEDLPLEQLVQMMAGGADLEVLSHELERAAKGASPDEAAELAETAKRLEDEAREIGLDGASSDGADGGAA
jgi:simple sugar transport system ATP-binding protein